jgi:hypothetical protein
MGQLPELRQAGYHQELVMSWAAHAIEALQRGETVTIRPRGHSMEPKVKHLARVTLEPLGNRTLAVGDVVLVRVKRRVYLHLITAKLAPSGYQIGNNKGHINGRANRDAIYGIAVEIA